MVRFGNARVAHTRWQSYGIRRSSIFPCRFREPKNDIPVKRLFTFPAQDGILKSVLTTVKMKPPDDMD